MQNAIKNILVLEKSTFINSCKNLALIIEIFSNNIEALFSDTENYLEQILKGKYLRGVYMSVFGNKYSWYFYANGNLKYIDQLNKYIAGSIELIEEYLEKNPDKIKLFM